MTVGRRPGCGVGHSRRRGRRWGWHPPVAGLSPCLGTAGAGDRVPSTVFSPGHPKTGCHLAVRARGWPQWLEQASPHARGGEMHVGKVTGSFSVSDTHWQTAGMETMQPRIPASPGLLLYECFCPTEVLNVPSDQVAGADRGGDRQSTVWTLGFQNSPC